MTMESWRWRTRSEEGQADDDVSQGAVEIARTATADGSGAVAPQAPLAAAGVTVVFGPLIERMSVGGMTVGEVRALVAQAFNIPATATALVDGARARVGRRLAPGETLEFTRESGEKGVTLAGAP